MHGLRGIIIIIIVGIGSVIIVRLVADRPLSSPSGGQFGGWSQVLHGALHSPCWCCRCWRSVCYCFPNSWKRSALFIQGVCHYNIEHKDTHTHVKEERESKRKEKGWREESDAKHCFWLEDAAATAATTCIFMSKLWLCHALGRDVNKHDKKNQQKKQYKNPNWNFATFERK